MGDSKLDIDEIIKKASQELSLDEETYVSFLNTLFTEGSEDIQKFSEAVESEDFETIQALSHRLKGEYGNIRLNVLAEPAVEIHNLTLNGGSIEQIRTSFAQLHSAYTQLRDAFK
jgi:HPt (histidine-containing phosphotransfer) domain-containing protein